jgi:hypothetical protein
MERDARSSQARRAALTREATGGISHLERNNWTNSFAGAEAGRKILKQQYEQMRAGLAELGLARD